MKKLLCKIFWHSSYIGASNEDYYNKEYYEITCSRCWEKKTVRNSRNLNY